MSRTAQVPGVLNLTAAVHLELSWDQTYKPAWVRQRGAKMMINNRTGKLMSWKYLLTNNNKIN